MLQRQQTFIRALQALPDVTVHFGQFMAQKKRMPLVDQPGAVRQALLRRLGLNTKVHPDGNVTVKIWRMEEKGSDVNLATYLLLDAFRGAFDKALVFSNDTDLCEPVRVVVKEFGLPVVVVNPRGHKQPAAALTDARGMIMKPEGW